MKTVLLTISALCLMCIHASMAWSYTIGTGFTESCHEVMTLEVYFDTETPPELEPLEAPIPKGDTWRTLANYLEEDNSLSFKDDRERLAVLSLMLGVRSPDTEGHSVTNLETLREAHTNPSGQYAHFLRSTNDDYTEGDVEAIEGSVKIFRDLLQIGLAYLDFPLDAQVIKTDVYLDFYGRIEMEVWAPLFYFGVALHILQDSFSHAVRSDDLTKIRHVMNFVEAVQIGHQPTRDGLAHSTAMDNCQGPGREISEGAKVASKELFLAMSQAIQNDSLDPVDEFIGRWFVYEEGCTVQNNFCGSKWAATARQDPTVPYFSSILDCTQVHAANGWRAVSLFLLLLGVLFWRRERRAICR